jgi:hypothetical protein
MTEPTLIDTKTAPAIRVLTFAVLASILGNACDPSTDRPDFGPLSGAIVDTMLTPPGTVIDALAQTIDSVGMTVRHESTRDGYLETRSFDVRSGVNRGRDIYNPERVIVLRFWADLIPGQRTRVTGEASYRTTSDPSLDNRLAEKMAARDHEGYLLLVQILRITKSRIRG